MDINQNEKELVLLWQDEHFTVFIILLLQITFLFIVYPRDDYFRFGSVFIKKKITKPIFFKKTKTEPKPVQNDRFWFFCKKIDFFWFGSVSARVFSSLARFLSWFFSVWVWFGFFGFRLIKPNRTGQFFLKF
jgi:hypothetical protein